MNCGECDRSRKLVGTPYGSSGLRTKCHIPDMESFAHPRHSDGWTRNLLPDRSCTSRRILPPSSGRPCDSRIRKGCLVLNQVSRSRNLTIERNKDRFDTLDRCDTRSSNAGGIRRKKKEEITQRREWSDYVTRRGGGK